jgi:mono/diheme cytochrome c family protein
MNAMRSFVKLCVTGLSRGDCRMILGATLALAGIGWVGVGAGSMHAAQPQSSPAAPSPGSQYSVVLNRYCVACHSEKLKTAGLVLEKADVANVPQGAEMWEKVIRKLRTGAMPPAGLPRPDSATSDAFAAYLETAIDRAAATKPNPGRPSVHRLNRAEYANAVRDVLKVDVDADSLLPPDDSGYGFDNIGAVLSVSPTLLERYLSAARKVSYLAVGDPAIRPVAEIYDVPKLLIQDDRMSEELPFGSRGGVAVRHNFPVDGEYVIKIRLQRNDGGTVRGVGLQRRVDARLDGTRLKLFTVGGEQKGPTDESYRPASAGAQEDYEHTADAGLELRIPVKAGSHLFGVSFFLEKTAEPEGVFRPRLEGTQAAVRAGKTDEPAVDSVTILGPYNVKGLGETPSRQKIFVCHPVRTEEEDACARKILSTLAYRAYRRPVTEEDLQALLKFYKAGRSEGNFEDGIRTALERMLVNLDFLFRAESDPVNVAQGTNYRVSDLELASRLSFFLWSSVPDDQLLDLAQHGKLKDPAVLAQQVRRMWSDPRAEAFQSNFFGQWLQLRHLPLLTPDPDEFPSFDENLRQAFRHETELFLESMLREDRPLMDLLDANYTFVNERLARHYGIPNVYGSSFRRVTLSDDNRRGLLGQGSILALTSYATRTSVVLRGVWVLDNILGTPPPAPPANVPALKDRGDDGKIVSIRQSMEEHRANPVCATCHARIDPIGFALENYDGIGKWRTTEGGAHTPIDTSAVLPDGTKINGPIELRKVLLKKPDLFATIVTEKLLTYALGRGVEYYDEPAVRKIVREAAPDYRWSSLISAIVKSVPFQMRSTRDP